MPHFRRTALEAALGWDPHNVTEDADLGLRLRRLGLRVGILHSTTWEEAPVRYRVWIGQRTRWLKGWMQTYLVHMRQPVRLYRELGGWAFLGFQLLMGSMIAAALVHPWFYGLIVAEAWSGGRLFDPPETLAASVVWWIAIVNLVLSYLTAIVAAGIGVVRRRRGRLVGHLVLLPVYWLLISWAAYRALAELVRHPHHWEKTPHRARRRGPASVWQRHA